MFKPIYVHQFKRTIDSDAENIYHSIPYKRISEFYSQGINLGVLKVDEYFDQKTSVGSIVVQFISPTIESERKRMLKLAEDEFFFEFLDHKKRGDEDVCLTKQDIHLFGQEVIDNDKIKKKKDSFSSKLDDYLYNLSHMNTQSGGWLGGFPSGSGANTGGSIP